MGWVAGWLVGWLAGLVGWAGWLVLLGWLPGWLVLLVLVGWFGWSVCVDVGLQVCWRCVDVFRLVSERVCIGVSAAQPRKCRHSTRSTSTCLHPRTHAPVSPFTSRSPVECRHYQDKPPGEVSNGAVSGNGSGDDSVRGADDSGS